MNMDNLKEPRKHGSDEFPAIAYNSTSSIPYHWHNEDEFIYMEKGSAEYNIGREKILIKEGDCAFCNSRSLHSLILDDSTTMNFKAFVYNRSYIFGSNDICRKYFNKNIKRHYSCKNKEDKEIIAIVQELCNLMNEHLFGYELEVKRKLIKLYSLIIKYDMYENDTDTEDIYEKNLLSAIEYIHANFTDKIYMNELAAITGYSVTHFEKLFKSYIGKTPSEYIMIYRLNTAERYLADTEYNVLEIAQMCGFPNVSYFIRIFNKFYRTTPHKYRQTLKAAHNDYLY